MGNKSDYLVNYFFEKYTYKEHISIKLNEDFMTNSH